MAHITVMRCESRILVVITNTFCTNPLLKYPTSDKNLPEASLSTEHCISSS